MRRREFITIAGSAAAWPLAARGQSSMRRVGVLLGLPQGDSESERWKAALVDGLSSLGWKPDSNVVLDFRWGSSDAEQMQKAAKELVGLHPDIIQVTTTPATAAILRETRTIPVVFSIVSDPVGAGFVQGLPHPGGNATGFINIEGSVGGKWLGLLKDIEPQTAQVLVLFNPKTAPQSYYLKAMEAAASGLQLTLKVAEVSSAAEIESAITRLAKEPHPGLVTLPDNFMATESQRDLIVSLTARIRIPAVYFFGRFVKAGGLISYGPDFADLQRRAAVYVDRILKGEKPEDLAVQLPTKFELAINTKAAAALGVKFPPSIIATADEVIE
jgi:putative ABC transport system substrate-binding protein